MPALDREQALPAPRSEEQAAARNWVDWLVAGSCTEGDFITQVLLLEDENPDVAFEVLALLDQRNRRHQLADDLFTRVKGRLLQVSLGYGVGEQKGSRTKVRTRTAPALRIEDPTKGRLRPGDTLKGRYRIVEILQRNDTGVVFEAIDEVRAELPDVPQRVAINLLSEECSRELALVQRLYRLQSLSHPCIVRIFDINEDDGELFFSMEWSPAQSLQQLLARTSGPSLTLQARQSTLGSVGAALAYVHSCGIAHGAVHAGNILIGDSGDVRLHGFELEGRKLVASCAADRLAYARLVHAVLWAGDARAEQAPPRADHEQAPRRPPGLTTDQWRLLKGALQQEDGEGATSSAVLALFSAGEPRSASFALQRAATVESRRRRSSPLARAAAVVAILGLGFYAVKEGEVDLSWMARDTPAAVAATVEPASTASLAPDAPVPVAPVTAMVAPSAAAAAPPPPPAPQPRAVLELPAGVLQVAEDEPVARIMVRRRGSLQGPVTFQWWTEASTAHEERDFAPVATRWEVIADGSPGIELLVPLVRGSARMERRVFYVKLHRAGMGATLGERTLAQVELLPAVIAPGNTVASQ